MSKSVAAVLFDVDGTLCEYERTGEELLALAFERVGVEPLFTVADYYERFGDAARDHDTVDEIRSHCFAELTAAAGRDPELGRQLAEVYAGERDHSNVTALPGVDVALDALDSDYRLGVVTNGGRAMQSTKLETLDVADRFETVVYAGDDPAPKPSTAPFEMALDALGVPAERAVHVGNSLEADVQGAHAAGLRAAWLPDGDPLFEPEPEPDFVLESMADLTDPPWT